VLHSTRSKKRVASEKLKNDKYYKGLIRLPPTVKQRRNRNQNNCNKTQTATETWDAYMTTHGHAPTNPSQLLKFSKLSPIVSALQYVEAREQFNRRMNTMHPDESIHQHPSPYLLRI